MIILLWNGLWSIVLINDNCEILFSSCVANILILFVSVHNKKNFKVLHKFYMLGYDRTWLKISKHFQMISWLFLDLSNKMRVVTSNLFRINQLKTFYICWVITWELDSCVIIPNVRLVYGYGRSWPHTFARFAVCLTLSCATHVKNAKLAIESAEASFGSTLPCIHNSRAHTLNTHFI